MSSQLNCDDKDDYVSYNKQCRDKQAVLRVSGLGVLSVSALGVLSVSGQGVLSASGLGVLSASGLVWVSVCQL